MDVNRQRIPPASASVVAKQGGPGGALKCTFVQKRSIDREHLIKENKPQKAMKLNYTVHNSCDGGATPFAFVRPTTIIPTATAISRPPPAGPFWLTVGAW